MLNLSNNPSDGLTELYKSDITTKQFNWQPQDGKQHIYHFKSYYKKQLVLMQVNPEAHLFI